MICALINELCAVKKTLFCHILLLITNYIQSVQCNIVYFLYMDIMQHNINMMLNVW